MESKQGRRRLHSAHEMRTQAIPPVRDGGEVASLAQHCQRVTKFVLGSGLPRPSRLSGRVDRSQCYGCDGLISIAYFLVAAGRFEALVWSHLRGSRVLQFEGPIHETATKVGDGGARSCDHIGT